MVTVAAFIEHFFVCRVEQSIQVTRHVSSSGLAQTTVANIRSLPEPSSDDTYTLGQLVSLLSPVGRDAFENESRVINRQLQHRFDRGEISAVYFYRCLARMTQEQLAERAGSRQSYISQIEQRRRPLTLKQAKKLAPALGVAPSQLFKDIA
jgi:DNA-binding XRE family transcriptional regulator